MGWQFLLNEGRLSGCKKVRRPLLDEGRANLGRYTPASVSSFEVFAPRPAKLSTDWMISCDVLLTGDDARAMAQWERPETTHCRHEVRSKADTGLAVLISLGGNDLRGCVARQLLASWPEPLL